MAANEFEPPFRDRDRETLVTFKRLAADPEFRTSFQLTRGEAVLFKNYAVLHNRTACEDHEEPHLKHHLTRLWLMDWDKRSKGCGTTRVGEVSRRSGTSSRITRIGIRRLGRCSKGGCYEVPCGGP